MSQNRNYTRTEAQIEASRINGAASRGPVTEEGKAISSRNNMRHGFLSNTVLIPGESQEEFDNLLAAIVAEFEPRTESEMLLVEGMVVANWRQLRAWAMDASGMAVAMEAQSETAPELLGRPLAYRAWAALDELGRSGTSERNNRFETRFSREYFRLYKALAARQSARQNLKDLAENF